MAAPTPDVSDIYYGHPGIMGQAWLTEGLVTHANAGKRDSGPAFVSSGMRSVDAKHFCDLYFPSSVFAGQARPLIIYMHGRNSDKLKNLDGNLEPTGGDVLFRNYFFPYLIEYGYIVLSCNWAQVNDLWEQTQFSPPYADALWLELWRHRVAQTQRLFDWVLDEFDLSDYTSDFTVDTDRIFPCGSSTGCSLMMWGTIAGEPGSVANMPNWSNLSRLCGMIWQWGGLPDPDGGGMYIAFNPLNPYYRRTDPPTCFQHGTKDFLTAPGNPGLFVTDPRGAAALFKDANAAGVKNNMLVPLKDGNHGPWSTHHAEIAAATKSFIESFDTLLVPVSRGISGSNSFNRAGRSQARVLF